jgi:Holliday junction resolvase RusA-like endonuclease
VSTQGGFARAYVPASHAIHAYRQEVQLRAKAAGVKASKETLLVMIFAAFGRPKSHFLKSGLKPTAPAMPRADVDNVAKGILDALGELAGNDTCVKTLSVTKDWGDPHTVVVVVPSGEMDFVIRGPNGKTLFCGHWTGAYGFKRMHGTYGTIQAM